jgi:hypothetical protein
MRALLVLGLASAVWAASQTPIASDAVRMTRTERMALLKTICGEKAGEHGCEVCPAGTEFPNDRLELDAVFYGHFLDPHLMSAAVMFHGCESHASGLGGTILLERDRAEWKFASLHPGYGPGDCKKLPASDGRDVLICAAADMHAGVRDDFLELIDFKARPEEDEVNGIFFMLDDSIADCAEFEAAGATQVVSGEIEQVTFAKPLSHSEITVRTRLGAAHLTESQMKYCQMQAGKGRNALATRIATVPKTYRFFFDGATVKARSGNPPINRGIAVPPKTNVIVPALFTAADKAFTIRVPVTYQILTGPKLAAAAKLAGIPVCQPSDLACFVYPLGQHPDTDLEAAAIEIARLDSQDEHSCLNPKRLPHSPAVSQPLTFSTDYRLGDLNWKYGYWEGSTPGHRIAQETFRAWHNGRCYQLAANIAENNTKGGGRQFTAKDETDIYHELGPVMEGFRFVGSQPSDQ